MIYNCDSIRCSVQMEFIARQLICKDVCLGLAYRNDEIPVRIDAVCDGVIRSGNTLYPIPLIGYIKIPNTTCNMISLKNDFCTPSSTGTTDIPTSISNGLNNVLSRNNQYSFTMVYQVVNGTLKDIAPGALKVQSGSNIYILSTCYLTSVLTLSTC